MNQEQLEKLITNLTSHPLETETVEFKENNFNKEDIGKRISALSNSANLHNKKNAYLVFGIHDITHDIVGTTFLPSNEKIGNDQLEFWLSQHINPRIDFRIYEFKQDAKNVVLFEIPPAINQPIKFNNIAYIRIGSATPKLSDYPEKESKIWNNIHRNSFEKGIAKENVAISEVLNLLDYSKYFSLTKQAIPIETQQFVKKMAQHGLVKKVFDNSYDITNLGAILFAKNLNDFPTVKRKSVRVVLYKGNTKVDRLKEYESPLGYAIAFESLLDYINDKLPHNEEISKSLRKDVKMYPEVAIREFFANALIHQDLSISGAGPMIEIFENRIEITNTGEPLIDTDRFIDHPPRSRNEDMASFMRQIGVCEEGGTGIDRALINIAIYQLPAPSFEKYENFTKVTLYAHKELRDMTIDDKVRACFQHCVLKYVESSRMTNATLRERLGIGEKNYPAASIIIRATIKKGLIKESEKSKEYVPIWA
ncbi:putative DNA binding domain-containing protein [Patescibacteria group bacterium]|nr:putative DNA binding domain-containing protein [Patescibacteria group bacterium]MBU4141992.1 putative DNA binding domain-containing protein [Patescibacteria group bacterium]